MRAARALLQASACVLACSASLLAGCAQAQGGFHKLAFDAHGVAKAGDATFQLAGPDNAAHPQLWEGPLTIAHGAARCDADVSLVKDVYADDAGHLTAAVTISGSSTYVHFVDTASCAKRWDRIKAFTDGASLAGDRLTILPACTPAGPDGVSQCQAGTVYKLSPTAAPALLQPESDALTQKMVGVSFSGYKKIAHAKTKTAKLMS